MNILILLALFSLLLLFPSPAKAEDAVEVKGELSLEGEYYLQTKEDCDREGALGKLELELSVKKENYEFYLNPVVRADSFGFAQGTFREYGNEDRHESYVTIREGYGLLKPCEWFQIGAGQKIFNWGVGEEINPTDFNPRRYLNLVEPEDLGLLSGWFTLKPGGFRLEGVICKPATSQLPWEEYYWWLPSDLKGVRIGEPDVPDKPQFAARMGWEGDSWKGYLSYFQGYPNISGFRLLPMKPKIIPGIPPVIILPQPELEPYYYRTQVFGLNFAADLGLVGLKVEAAYKDPHNKSGQDEYVQWLVGLDKYFTWSDFTWSAGSGGSLYILLQYVREDVTNRGPNKFQQLDFSRLLKNAITVKADLELGKWGLSLRGAYETDEKGIYLQPKISRWIGDHLQASVGCDLLSGSKDSVFGKYDRNDRVFMILSWHF